MYVLWWMPRLQNSICRISGKNVLAPVMATRRCGRTDRKSAKEELGFQYVRFHGILDDDMCVVQETEPGKYSYNFFNIDNIFDFLLRIGMKPFLEIGFMPTPFASGEKTCFHYKGNITPPKDYQAWDTFITAMIRHFVERYGLAEVRQWFFEVWNEPNLQFFFTRRTIRSGTAV